MNRRQFFERSGRWLSGGLLGLLAGYLALEREISPPASCSENAFCRQCMKFSGCKKLQALETRSFERTKPDVKKQPYGKR